MVAAISWRGWTALALILVLVGALVLPTLEQVEYQTGADEAYYLLYASNVAEHGVGAFPTLCAWYLQNPQKNQHFPPPTRLNAVMLGAVAVRLGGVQFAALSKLSLATLWLALLVTFIGLACVFGERMACWGTLFLAASPLHLGLSRRALMDVPTSALMMISLWALWWALQGKRERSALRWGVVSVFFAAVFLTKESSLMLIPFSLAWLLWDTIRRKSPIPWGPICAVSVIPLAVVAVLLSLVVGGPGVFWQVMEQFRAGVATNEYAQLYEQGPWIRYAIDGLLLSPWTVMPFFVWLGLLIALPQGERRFWFWTLVPLFFFIGLALFPARNVRLALFLEFPLRLGAVFLLQWWCVERFKRAGALIGIALLLSFFAADLLSYGQLFLASGIYDPLSNVLLRAHHIVPLIYFW